MNTVMKRIRADCEAASGRHAGWNSTEHNLLNKKGLVMAKHVDEAIGTDFFELIKSFLLPWRRQCV